MPDPVAELLETYGAALRDAARLEADAEHLEHMRKVVLAEEMNRITDAGGSVAKAENLARGTDRYKTHLVELHRVKAAAGEARAKAVYLDARIGVWRTRMATARQQHRGKQ